MNSFPVEHPWHTGETKKGFSHTCSSLCRDLYVGGLLQKHLSAMQWSNTSEASAASPSLRKRRCLLYTDANPYLYLHLCPFTCTCYCTCSSNGPWTMIWGKRAEKHLYEWVRGARRDMHRDNMHARVHSVNGWMKSILNIGVFVFVVCRCMWRWRPEADVAKNRANIWLCTENVYVLDD